MSTAILDPWTDAAIIAARLSNEGTRLVIVIGAEAWCATCREYRLNFDSIAREKNDPQHVWLWLDLEDHAEFIGDFVPDNLPFMMSYVGKVLTHALVPQVASGPTLTELLAQSEPIEFEDRPDIRKRLLRVDWAT